MKNNKDTRNKVQTRYNDQMIKKQTMIDTDFL
jgi:hypothetical protein